MDTLGMRTRIITMVVLAIIITTTTAATSVQAVFEDDGEFVPDGEEQSQEEQEQQEEEYDDRNLPTYDQETGKYNDEDDNGIDDDSKANDDEKNLPRCAYLVVKDCTLNDLGQTCEVGTSDDPCQDIFYGYDGNYKPGEKIKDSGPAADKPNPYCDTPEGKAAKVCHDRLDYDEVTGLAPCNDGTQKADYKDCKDASKKNDDNDNDNGNHNSVIPSLEASGLKNCGDGIVAVSCGVGRYWCEDSTGEYIHTNYLSECDESWTS
jgi:hypothetical protein